MKPAKYLQAFENIRESSLLFVKADLALIAGISTLDYFKEVDNAEALFMLGKFGFIIGTLLILIVIGIVIEFSSTIMKNRISLESDDNKAKDLKFELKITRFVYGTQIFGHILMLGVLHSYLLNNIG